MVRAAAYRCGICHIRQPAVLGEGVDFGRRPSSVGHENGDARHELRVSAALPNAP